MSKILVTGAAGFIGSHLVERLLREGHQVRAFVRYNSASKTGWLEQIQQSTNKNLEIIFGDIRDFDIVNDSAKGCETIFHLGALISIPYSYKAPVSYIETNVKGTVNVLQAALNNSCKKVIHTSTSEVYGSAQYVPIDEKHPINTQSPYSASKASADLNALSYYYSFNLPVCVIRPFNTFGPRQSLRAVIPNAICQILDSKDGKISLGAISTTRDFSYVDRTVDGFYRTMSASNLAGKIINLGTGFEISIEQMVGLVSKILNKNITILSDKERLRPEKSEVNRLYAEISLAKELLSLPEVEPLEEFTRGLTKTCEWFSNPDNRRLYLETSYQI